MGPLHGLSLFSGVCGLELGVRRALGGGLRTVCYCEQDAYAASVIVARMEDETLDRAPVWDDVSTFDGTSWRGCVDILTASLPCGPWSTAGQQRGEDDEKWLWDDTVRILEECGASLFFTENVPPFKKVLGTVLTDLAELGFDATWGMYSAAAQGAPHVRRRLFLLAHAHGFRRQRHVVARACRRWPQTTDGRDRWDPEPEVPRVVDGSPRVVDELRCSGNAVVPIVAANAFIDLGRELFGIQDQES